MPAPMAYSIQLWLVLPMYVYDKPDEFYILSCKKGRGHSLEW